MKICFVQSVLEINLIKKRLGFLPVIVPLSLETQVHCDLEKINYLDPENYIDKDFYRKGNDKLIRNYGIGAQIIKDLKIKNMTLITKSPKKVIGLDGYGIKITNRN